MNSAVFSAPANFAIRATASDTSDDFISDVQFFLGNTEATNLLEDVYTLPFTTSVTNLASGTYNLMAVATDSRGAQSTNTVSITVLQSSAKVNLAAPRWSAGNFLIDAEGLTPGKTNILLISSDLVSWQKTATNVAVEASMTLTNPPVSATCFYRLLQLP